MTSETPTTPAPGWYTAPGEPGLERLWTGEAWGDERRPAPPAVSTGRRGTVIAGFVISIIALLLSLAGAGFLPGILAALLASIPKRRAADHGMATAAVVMSVIAMVLSVIVVAVRVTSG